MTLSSSGSCDAAVQGTTEEAAISKLSAANMGYFEDKYLRYFVKPSSSSAGYRRSPLVHRGYFSRVSGIRKVVQTFLDCCKAAGHSQPQIVNLGAGLDSLSFWILDNSEKQVQIFEVDHPEIVARKTRLIAQTPALRDALGEGVSVISDQLRSPRLRLVSADLRNLDRLKPALEAAGMSGNRPTLFICECVLIYMHSADSDKLLRWASDAVQGEFSAVAVYEQTNPDDAFGRVMVKALAQRGCPLLGITGYPALADQHGRFKKAGFEEVDVATMNDIFDKCIPDVGRIKKIEMFDEFEEWRLMQAHYFMAVACKSPNDETKAKFASLANIWACDVSATRSD